MIARILLFMAMAGLLSSTIYLLLVMIGALRFRSALPKAGSAGGRDVALPPVSVLKPLHRLEPRLEQNLESFFRQNYPQYEVLLAVHEEADPAGALARQVCARYPQVPSRVLVSGRPWPNPPAYSFHCMSEVAAHEILVTSDSDVEVSPCYLREVVPPLLDPKVGMVTCLYRGKNAGGFWSGLDAIGMSVEMTAGVLVVNLLEGMKFGLGPTIAVRKDSLASIGGYPVLGQYFSNDFVIGNLIDKAGYRVVLSGHVIDHVVPPMTFSRMWEREVRWAKGTVYSRPKGHLGTGLTFAMPYGILGLLAALGMGRPLLGTLFLGAALANRLIEAWVVGWGVVRDKQARRYLWLYPLRDLLGFLVWCASYLSPRTAWRDSRYELLPGGRIVRRESPPGPASKE